MDTAARYRTFAAVEARGKCDLYDTVCHRIADDPALLALIDHLPEERRQPNLVLAAVRYLGVSTADPDAFVAELHRQWPRIEALARSRRTQTNEPARTATLLPILAGLPQPLALIEVGASAGLCLYPDRYSYRYEDRPRIDPDDGPSEVLLTYRTTGDVPIPSAVPAVAVRAGIDLNPLNVADDDDVRWLESLVWPGQPERRDRLRAALRIARRAPAVIHAGDLLERIERVVRDAVETTETVVVFHSAVLSYLPAAARSEFVRVIRELPCRWIANEGPGVLGLPIPPAGGSAGARFVLSLDGVPLARTDPHGESIDWLPVRS